MTTAQPALRFSGVSAAALVLGSVAGLGMFLWPLLFQPAPGTAHVSDAPFLFILILPLITAVIVGEVQGGRIDVKALAMLGVLSGVGAVLRPLGAGTAGIETVFFLLILGGRVYGPAFGFVLGSTTLFTSALLTAGVGPWLPFQMMAASWTGMGAGLLPQRVRGRAEIYMLVVYGIVAALAYGFLLNMWFWPFAIGGSGPLSFVPGDAVVDNLRRFALFCLATSTWGWDMGRAITNTTAILIAGPAVLATLRRSVRRAAFDAEVVFPGEPSDRR